MTGGLLADGALPLLLGDAVGDWREQALCAQTDPDVFFPDKGETGRTAKRICALCPVRDPCLDYALDNDERFGVWGGLSEQQRRRISRTPTASGGSRTVKTARRGAQAAKQAAAPGPTPTPT